ncbi:hypothetical protein H696_01586 [Fonticula alba]|uniref:Uncharacterized protein n=1 Tax=Fonticula alba TaxID=691883 RepID=A0A058ZCS5_FONAL|nr:hypothetical protein H696_01586 [Fonticula alba]KCV72184.1 hypothetical protein H696_01586 [Fonticula alba]|eukprot:XP_009493762.1 hypothetical protein H696_01586 [Fonticula alba]
MSTDTATPILGPSLAGLLAADDATAPKPISLPAGLLGHDGSLDVALSFAAYVVEGRPLLAVKVGPARRAARYDRAFGALSRNVPEAGLAPGLAGPLAPVRGWPDFELFFPTPCSFGLAPWEFILRREEVDSFRLGGPSTASVVQHQHQTLVEFLLQAGVLAVVRTVQLAEPLAGPDAPTGADAQELAIAEVTEASGLRPAVVHFWRSHFARSSAAEMRERALFAAADA